jgi:hypothetical protein
MPPKVPDWFIGRIRSYDAALRLRWSPEARQFCLERRISNIDAGRKEEARAQLHAIASKPLREPVRPRLWAPAHYWQEIQAKYRDQAARRIRALNELEALVAGYLFILHVPPPLDQYTLEAVMYTLRRTDTWAHGGADRMAAALDYEEVLAERRRAESLASDHHELAADAFRHSQAKAGERIIVPDGLPGGSESANG